jgi:hypothetical protein
VLYEWGNGGLVQMKKVLGDNILNPEQDIEVFGIGEDVKLAFVVSASARMPLPLQLDHATGTDGLSTHFDNRGHREIQGDERFLPKALNQPARNPVANVTLRIEEGCCQSPRVVVG